MDDPRTAEPYPLSRPSGGTPSAAAGAPWAAIVIAALTISVFLPALSNGFVNWDDDENFVFNPHYRGLGWAQVRWMFTAAHMGHYIPLTWLTLGLDYVLWGMDPRGYHLTSVLLHAVNAALFYLVGRRLLAAAFRGLATPASLTLGATTAALLFALHPLRVESVAWVTERRDLVAGLFALVTTLAYLAAWRRGTGGRLHRGWYWAAVGFSGLALLGKSIVVGLPLVLVALDLYPLRRASQAGVAWPGRVLKFLVEKTPFLALSAAMSAVILMIGADRRFLIGLEALGLAQRLAITGYGLAFYLWKTLVPGPLSPLYTLFSPVEPLGVPYVATGATALAITLGLVLGRRRWPAGLTAWACYVILLLPVSGLFHNGPQIAADRYTYLACLPWALLGGAGVGCCWEAGRRGRLSPALARGVAAAAALVLVAFTALTVKQIGIWRDSVTLWRHAAALEPESDFPIFYLGWGLAEQGRTDEARGHFEQALGRVPDRLALLRAQLQLHIGLLEQRAGNLAEAERWFRAALAADREHPVATIRLGLALLARGETAEAERLFATAARLAPDWPRYQVWELREAISEVPMAQARARAALAFALGLVLQHYGALEEAAEHYRLAVSLVPGDAAAWNNLGVTYAVRGRDREALEAFLRALHAHPGHPDGCRNARRVGEALRVEIPELSRCGRGP